MTRVEGVWRGDRLRRYIESSGRDPAEIAEQLGMHADTLARYQAAGSEGPRASTLAALCCVLGIPSADELIDVREVAAA